jgi:hypothetical protein
MHDLAVDHDLFRGPCKQDGGADLGTSAPPTAPPATVSPFLSIIGTVPRISGFAFYRTSPWSCVERMTYSQTLGPGHSWLL